VGKTSIEWTDHSWPIVNGCRRISPGCGRARGKGGCYAERLISTRLSKTPKYQGLAVFGENGPRWTGETRLWEPHLAAPLRLRTPSKIFVADMGDLFYEGVSDRDIDRVFGVMWACRYLGRGDNVYPGHVFQVLTKRAERMRDYLSGDRKALARRWADQAVDVGGGDNPDALHDSIAFETKPHPRMWLGVSVENADFMPRVDHLLDTPAAVRFLSLEPLLGPIALNPGTLGCVGHLSETFGNPLIHQVIVGGESGPGAAPMDPAWVRSLRDTVVDAGAAFFFKQWGGVRKKLAGRELDGRTWDEFPADRAKERNP
jgi:protein gp37